MTRRVMVVSVILAAASAIVSAMPVFLAILAKSVSRMKYQTDASDGTTLG